MKEKIKFDSKVISIGSNSNDLYMELDMVLLDDVKNLNDVRFTEEFLADVETNKSIYIGLPLVGDMNALTSGKYDKLTHKFNKKDNSFSTQALGSFVDFKTQKDGDITQLIASVRIWKRFPKVCTAIEELFNSDQGLTFSYETYVGKYLSENGVKIVDVDDSNTIISSCIVSTPANPNSIALTLCAAIESDFIDNNQTIEGGEKGNMERNKENFTIDNMFENSKINLAELDLSQVKTKLFNQMREKMEDNYWMFDCVDIGIDYCVMKNYSTGDLMKIEYSVANNEVSILDMYDVDKTYTKKVTSDNKEEEMKIAELELEIATLKETAIVLNATIETNKVELASANEKLIAKDVEIASVNDKLTSVSETLIAKETEIAELAPIKLAHETMLAEKAELELAEKKTALKERFSKVMSAEVLVEMAEAFENLDIAKLNEKVVETAMAISTSTVSSKAEVGSRITDSVNIGKNDIVSKYITINE